MFWLPVFWIDHFTNSTWYIFSPDAELRARALDFALSDAVRSNDTPFVIAGVAKAGWEGRDQTWAFVKNKYPIFLERFVSCSSLEFTLVSDAKQRDAVFRM